MRTLNFSLCLFAVMLFEMGSMAQRPDDQESVRLGATLILAPTVVTDSRGRPVADLSKGDFTISEDGRRQDLAVFASVAQPFTAAIVLDTSNSASDRLKAMKGAAISFINQLRPGDRAMIIAFDHEVRPLTGFSSDRVELEGAVEGVESGFGKLLYEAVSMALDRLRNEEGRRAIVLFSDCVDMRSVDQTAESTIRRAERTDAAAYVVQFETRWWIEAEARKQEAMHPKSKVPFSVDVRIPLPPDLGGPDPTPREFPRAKSPTIKIGPDDRPGPDPISANLDRLYGEADRFAETLASRTGGRAFKAERMGEVEAAFALIAEELRSQYLLGYYADPKRKDGKFHKIKVEVTRKGLSVRARDGYREVTR